MQILFKGRYFSKEKRNLLGDLAEWCANKMLGPRLSRNVSVTIHIVPPERINEDRLYGLTDVHEDDDWNRPRNFKITITSKYGIMRSLMILAHEMVHVKQHARQELAFCGRTGLPKWHGVRIDEPDQDYWDLPWEIEAHGREKGLVYQWCKERGHLTKAWFKEVF